MTTEIIAAGVFAGLILAWFFWDVRRAERKWKKRTDWLGSPLSDPKRDRAFPKKRSWEKDK